MGRSKAIVVQEHQQRGGGRDELLGHCTRPSSIRIRRALLLLAGKRGPATPVPSWKLYDNVSFTNAAAEACSAAAAAGSSVSARKLAATLWELQELPLWNGPGPAAAKASSRSSSNQRHHHRQSNPQQQQQQQPPPSPTTPAPHKMAKPSSTKSSDSMRRSPFTDSLHSRRTSEDTYTSETSPELESSQETVVKPPNSPATARGKRMSKTTTSADEFVKLLSSIRSGGGEEQQRNTALLRAELEQARRRVRQLEQANKLARREIEGLLLELRGRAVAEGELEEERRARAAAESACRRVAAEVEQARAAAAAAVAEAEREKEARRVMEEVCDELAREIGRDKAEVEELRAATRKAREEVEEERRMLQLAEVWREERVQMKLAEARMELEEKSAALDRFRTEIEGFLASKRPGQPQHHTSQRLVPFSQRGHDSSGDDEDLHWIDLNKESLYDRTQGNRWTEKQSGRGGGARRGRTRKLRRSKRLIPLQQNAGSSSGSSNSSGDEARRAAAAVRMRNAGKSVSIETIPEHRELYSVQRDGADHDATSCTTLSGSEGAFSLARRSFEGTGTGKTPALSPMLRSSTIAAATSTSTTPHRNSWSAGDANLTRGAVPDNSLRAMLLMEDPPLARPRGSKRGK